jgi:RNA polymerase sigma-70 factor (ECF subfamily)
LPVFTNGLDVSFRVLCIFFYLHALYIQITKHLDPEQPIPDDALKKEWELIKASHTDPRFFEALYHKHYNQVFRFVYSRTRIKELAADITADVFLKALLNLKNYNFQGTPFIAWLIRIALNEVAQYYRKTAKARVVAIDDQHLVFFLKELDTQPQKENLELVAKLLEHLEVEEVNLIELRIFEARAFKEIGDILGITENNAKVRFYRIIDKLKKVYQENYHGQ